MITRSIFASALTLCLTGAAFAEEPVAAKPVEKAAPVASSTTTGSSTATPATKHAGRKSKQVKKSVAAPVEKSAAPVEKSAAPVEHSAPSTAVK